MFQFLKKITRIDFIDYLIGIFIFIIPLYSIRIPFYGISISILTIYIFVISAILLIYHYHHIIPLWKSNKILFLIVVGFVCSFLPSLFLHPGIHAYGVFFEWIFYPAILGLLLSIHFYYSPRSHVFLINTFVFFSLFFVFFALSYYLSNVITYDGRLSFIYLSPNHLAMFITPILTIILTSWFIYNDPTRRTFITVIFMLLCTVLFFTQSFTSICAFLVTSFFGLLFFIKRRSLIVCSIMIFFVIFGLIGYQKIVNSNPDFHRSSIVSRVAIFDTTFFLLQKSSLYGYEIDSFQINYLSSQPYFTPYLDWAVPTPHNLLLTLLFSGGFFSLLFFLILISFLLYKISLSYLQSKNRVYIIYAFAIITIFITGTFDTPYWKNDLSVIFWIIFSLTSPSILNDVQRINKSS